MRGMIRNSGLIKSDILNVLKVLRSISDIDINSFYKEAGAIDTSNAGVVSYSFDMLFRIITPPDNTYPSKPIDVKLSMEVNENLQNNEETIEGTYMMQLFICGLKNGKSYMCNWHLDLDPGTDRRYMHPRYHLTYGGKKMRDEIKKDADYFGQSLMLATPRLPIAPMDGILAIDFVLNHFYKTEKISAVLNNTRYREAVKASQKRIWAPYYRSIHEHFSGGALAHKGKQYVPNLI